MSLLHETTVGRESLLRVFVRGLELAILYRLPIGPPCGEVRRSVKVPRARQELAQERRAVDQPPGDEMRDAVLLLQLTVHLEQA